MPEKADEIMCQEEQKKVKAYINRQGAQTLGRLEQWGVQRRHEKCLRVVAVYVCCRSTDLLLLEVDAEVQEFVATLKDWSLKW